MVVVKTAKNATLGKTILVGLNGHTLYDLSVERKGKFICTNKTCLSLWHPQDAPMDRESRKLGVA